MIEFEEGIRMQLQFDGIDSPCLGCPLSIYPRVGAVEKFGENLKEIIQYCGYSNWKERIAEVHQTVVYLDPKGNPQIKENQTFSAKKPKNCKLA